MNKYGTRKKDKIAQCLKNITYAGALFKNKLNIKVPAVEGKKI